MAEIVQQRRGSTSDHDGFIGAVGEITVDTTKKTAVVHDGETPGGFPLAREDAENTDLVVSTTIHSIVTIWETDYAALTAKDPYTLYIVIPITLQAPNAAEYEWIGLPMFPSII